MSQFTERRTVEIVMDNSQAAKTIKDINNDIRTLGNHIQRNLRPGTKEFEVATLRLRELKEQSRQWRAELNLVGQGASRLKQELRNITIGVLGGNLLTAGAAGVVDFFKGAIETARTLSDTMADVRKVTNLTDDQFADLQERLGKMDTRKSRKELLELAVAAGKAGEEGVDAIAKFVEEANVIDVALGEDLGEGAITQISKIAKLFNKSMLEIASGINEIGSKSEANEAYLVNFSYRLAGTANTVKLAADEVLGYGSVLDQMGLQVEMSSTALNGFFIDFVKNTDKFEKAAGMTAGSLKKLIGEKGTNAGFLSFLETLKAANPEADKFLKKLEDIGIDGDRGSQVFLALSNNLGLVRREQELGKKAIEENISVLDEYDKKNTNFAAQYEKALKQINAALLPLKESFVAVFFDVLSWLADNVKLLGNIAKAILVGATAWGVYKAVTIAAKISQSQLLATILASNKMLLLQEIAITSTGIATALFTGNMKKLKQEWLLLNALMKTSPWGIALGAIAAITAAVILFGNKTSELTKIQNEAKKTAYSQKIELERLNKVVQDNTMATVQRKDAVNRLREAMPELLQNISDEAIMTGAATKAIEKHSEALFRNALAAGARSKAIELAEELIDKEQLLKDLVSGGATSLTNVYGIRYSSTLKRIEAIKEEINQLQKLTSEYEAPAKKVSITGVDTSNIDAVLNTPTKPNVSQGGAAPSEKEIKAAEAKEREKEKILKIERETQAQLSQLKAEAIKEGELRDIAELASYHKIKQQEIAALKTSEAKKKELLLAENEVYQTELSALEQKWAKKRSEDEFDATMNNLDKWRDQSLIAWAELYAEGHISHETYQQKIKETNANYLDAKKIAYQDYGKGITETELEIAENNAKIRESEEDANARSLAAREELAYIMTTEGSAARLEVALENLQSQMEMELEIAELTESEKELIRARYAQKEKELRDAYNREQVQKVQDTVRQLNTIYLDLVQARLNKEMSANDEKENRAIAELDKRLKAGAISEEQYAVEKQRIQQEHDAQERELKRQAFLKNQEAAFIENIINTAVAVVKAAPNPFLMTLAAAAGVASGILIKSQKPPEYGKGVLLDGPLHSDSSKGMPIVNPYTGQVQAYVEGGEAVLSRSTVTNNWPIVSKLLDSSMNYNGKSVTEVPQFNFGNINRAVGVSSFADGGILPGAKTTTNQTGNLALFNQSMLVFYELVQELKTLQQERIAAERSMQDVDVKSTNLLADSSQLIARAGIAMEMASAKGLNVIIDQNRLIDLNDAIKDLDRQQSSSV